MSTNKQTVALFATCLVDIWRPGVAAAARALVKEAGYSVETPRTATCCGQVAHNSGDIKGARRLALHHIILLTPFDFVVVPSGSCTGMIKNQYPALFEKGSNERKNAKELAAKTFELTSFLTHIAIKKPNARKTTPQKIAVHDSCSCFRELGIRDEPRKLLSELSGTEVVEIAQPERCCGFGGLFSVKFSKVSAHLADQKIAAVKAAGADVLVGADLGCLLSLESRLQKDGSNITVKHIAEVLVKGCDNEN